MDPQIVQIQICSNHDPFGVGWGHNEGLNFYIEINRGESLKFSLSETEKIKGAWCLT